MALRGKNATRTSGAIPDIHRTNQLGPHKNTELVESEFHEFDPALLTGASIHSWKQIHDLLTKSVHLQLTCHYPHTVQSICSQITITVKPVSQKDPPIGPMKCMPDDSLLDELECAVGDRIIKAASMALRPGFEDPSYQMEYHVLGLVVGKMEGWGFVHCQQKTFFPGVREEPVGDVLLEVTTDDTYLGDPDIWRAGETRGQIEDAEMKRRCE